jgi:fumarylacetoacetase
VSERAGSPGDHASPGGFGLDHLPYGVFTVAGGGPARVGVRFGDGVLDLSSLDPTVFATGSLNAFLALGRSAWAEVRAQARDSISRGAALVPLEDVVLLRPVDPPDYVDFYSSLEHATNVGRLFRPDDPLPENWRWLPIGYHGRSSTVVVSGTPVRRPRGQLGAGAFGPTGALDFELELGFVTGAHPGPVPISEAGEVIFGVAMVNDWSARDIQRWEYQPLGPFLGKSFATSISPWVVPLEALAAARVDGPVHDPAPLPYLERAEPWALDLALEVAINGSVVSRPPFATMYWTPDQMLAHLTVNGASTRTGDLYASGTVSGPEPGQRGSLIELSWNGAEPLTLADGSTRTFLEDGDTVTISATAPSADGGRLSLGEVTGTIHPARRSE